jgi:hypothetical protein
VQPQLLVDRGLLLSLDLLTHQRDVDVTVGKGIFVEIAETGPASPSASARG